MHRRRFLKAGLAWPLAFVSGALADDPVYIADMHYHMFFPGEGLPFPPLRPLARNMAGGNATLVAWSLVGDLLWMRSTAGGLKQNGSPKRGQAFAWFEQELARIKQHIADQNLKIVRTPADVDLALRGDPHVVLSVEGASFLDEDPKHLEAAYELGVRHIQLVHYITNTIGDFQTEPPRLHGLTPAGQGIVKDCNRLGILVDLAHCAQDVVTAALAVSTAPMVWSHSSVTRAHKPTWSMTPWRARQLSVESARAIAAKGGVVGLWTLRSDTGPTVEAYADRLLETADWLGEDHVAFGTDMNALASPFVASFADLQRVVGHWRRRNVEPGRIRKLAIENYARVLKQALGARQA
jgi:membrane dipeptidase